NNADQGEPMKRTDADRINENIAVYIAMMDAGYKKKPTMPAADFARAYGREAVAQQRRYCNAFAFWRRCRISRCRRARGCVGYAFDCLKRAVRSLPEPAQVRVQQELFKGVPRNIGAPE